MTTCSVPARLDVDLTDPANFDHGFPYHLFDAHRREAPVFWHEPTAHTPDGEGFWSVATYTETIAVLRDSVTFSSETGGKRPFGGTLLQDFPVSGRLINMMDDPRHAAIRRLVSSGLGPRMIGRIEDDLRRRARRLFDQIKPGEPFDFAADVAAELPTQMICILLGVPEVDRHWLFEEIEAGLNFRGSSKQFVSWIYGTDAQSRRDDYGRELIARKRAEPGDDMLSIVANATVDGQPFMSDEEVYLFFHQLFSAGSDTTRSVTSVSLLALAQRPDQWHQLRRDPGMLPTAIEEFVRWTTPSPSKRRTATRDVTLAGHHIEEGQKVLVWDASANRDPSVFDRADEFDITRKPNPHLGFGQGVHYCLGATLARLELRVFFEELLPRFERVEVLAPPEWAGSNRRNGLRSLQVRMH
ncbi:cytochrome P450 [Mycobacterium paragordonae]|uniref:Cytochrome P450 n=1 Tax=Mycobacterium paragordonae TaxID=1389713 RepID=A0A4R5WVI7_9MYCO|nr:cytochrome P450 [Mycobacterium paragordonae]MDP7736886.1 cytochrome P450 [Mycobacterium paragordonae]TDK98724.1 cytochrome P450 [Mycobacterium paragordonae]TDL09047.1 cytochrome P450 [Mycobacterium paragordonae]